MQTESKKRIWTSRIAGGLVTLFLLFDALGKLLKLVPVREGTVALGYSESVLIPLGILLGTCTILYIIPRSSFLGAILLTGYLGGAVATHVRAGDPLFPILFPVILGTLLWGALWLRDPRVRSLLPVRQ